MRKLWLERKFDPNSAKEYSTHAVCCLIQFHRILDSLPHIDPNCLICTAHLGDKEEQQLNGRESCGDSLSARKSSRIGPRYPERAFRWYILINQQDHQELDTLDTFIEFNSPPTRESLPEIMTSVHELVVEIRNNNKV